MNIEEHITIRIIIVVTTLLICVAMLINAAMSSEKSITTPPDGAYHHFEPLTDTYDSGCIYKETIAIELPEGVPCPEHIAILY